MLGVNLAVDGVLRQEALKARFPPGERLRHRLVSLPMDEPAASEKVRGEAANESAVTALQVAEPPPPGTLTREVTLIERAHPDLGRLGVLWHMQGSGKSYSMLVFAEKVRRKAPGNFTFLLMTDRHDLDTQIYKILVGCGVADEATPRPASGDALRSLLGQNHRHVFSLIHNFNQDVDPARPHSERDDIIVISDEAQRTQSGRMARNLHIALPNAAFIGFTGTALFKHAGQPAGRAGDVCTGRRRCRRGRDRGAAARPGDRAGRAYLGT